MIIKIRSGVPAAASVVAALPSADRVQRVRRTAASSRGRLRRRPTGPSTSPIRTGIQDRSSGIPAKHQWWPDSVDIYHGERHRIVLAAGYCGGQRREYVGHEHDDEQHHRVLRRARRETHVAPINTVQGNATSLSSPVGIVFNANGDMFRREFREPTGSGLVQKSPWNSARTPSAIKRRSIGSAVPR